MQVPGAPWWLNWFVIYPSNAVAAVTAALMVVLMVCHGLAGITSRKTGDED